MNKKKTYITPAVSVVVAQTTALLGSSRSDEPVNPEDEFNIDFNDGDWGTDSTGYDAGDAV